MARLSSVRREGTVDYPNYDPGASAAAIGFAIAVFSFEMLFLVAVYAVTSWLLSRIYRKVGIPQWKAWVPVYNNWVFLELGGQQGWLAILTLIPFANLVGFVFLCIAAYRIGLGFGKSAAWVLLYIFLSVVWLAILAFDSSRWEPWRIPGPGAPYGYLPPPDYYQQQPPA